ncbi:hypothetical protein Q8A73_020772 [Channa argus]|nr:hypothetical protein Q8A73_020772 [Channa argus]
MAGSCSCDYTKPNVNQHMKWIWSPQGDNAQLSAEFCVKNILHTDIVREQLVNIFRRQQTLPSGGGGGQRQSRKRVIMWTQTPLQLWSHLERCDLRINATTFQILLKSLGLRGKKSERAELHRSQMDEVGKKKQQEQQDGLSEWEWTQCRVSTGNEKTGE